MTAERPTCEAEATEIGARAFQGSVVGIGASGITLVLGFLRSVLLARLIIPDSFGVITLALFYIGMAARLRALGLDRALIHRQDADEDALDTYFTLRVATSTASLLVLLGVAYLVSRLGTSTLNLSILLILAGVDFVKVLSTVQETLLSKALAFRALATTDVVASVAMTVVAPLLAWQGFGVWALVAEQASGIFVRFVLTWFVFGRLRPRLGWQPSTARWFLRYGGSAWGASSLAFLNDRFDDFWIGTTLGDTQLGYYSTAYGFAHYPRRVVANPIVGVFSPIFSRLQHDRLRLSQAFYRAAHIILRSGFLLAGGFALVMPEFISLVIGQQWAPMLLTFRLMLVYTLLDALLMLSGNLLMAVGQPSKLQRSRLVQAIFFIPAVLIGARLWGISGVALAADGMLVVGAWMLYHQLRSIVDFSLVKLGLWPLVALCIAFGAGLWAEVSIAALSPWLMGIGKLALFSGIYLGILALAEHGDYLKALKWFWHHAGLPGRKASPS